VWLERVATAMTWQKENVSAGDLATDDDVARVAVGRGNAVFFLAD